LAGFRADATKLGHVFYGFVRIPGVARSRKESEAMRLLFTSFSFILTLIVGAIAFAATAIEFPSIMREFIAVAQMLPAYLSSFGLSDRYMVWIDILLSGDKLVLLGFVLATRIIFAVLGGVFGPLFESGTPRASFIETPHGKSPFHGWGAPR
jgi:hypothetical protein